TDEHEDALQAEFVDSEEYDRFFQVEHILTLNSEAVAQRPGLAKRLVAALGADADVLIKKTTIKPTEAFLTAVMTNPVMTRRWNKLKESGLCRLQKLTLAE
ncbi:MAG: hypothetical protein WC341_12910, partial [Bacteroidales bacterium]